MPAPAKTERITVRLTKHILDIVDALVDVGEVESRSVALRQAVKEFVDKRTELVKGLEARLQEQDELKQLAAKVGRIREFSQK